MVVLSDSFLVDRDRQRRHVVNGADFPDSKTYGAKNRVSKSGNLSTPFSGALPSAKLFHDSFPVVVK